MQVTGSRGKKALALQQGLGCGPRMVLTHSVSSKDAEPPYPTPTPFPSSEAGIVGCLQVMGPLQPGERECSALWDEAVPEGG